MNWEALSALGDVVGAFAILVTLIYLAFQLKQNTRQVKIAALQSTMGQWNSWSEVLAGSPDLAAIVARGNEDFHALDPPDALRYSAYIQIFFDAVENYHDQILEVGIRGNESVLASIVQRRIRIQGFAQWWEDNQDDYETAFCAWINALLHSDDGHGITKV